MSNNNKGFLGSFSPLGWALIGIVLVLCVVAIVLAFFVEGLFLFGREEVAQSDQSAPATPTVEILNTLPALTDEEAEEVEADANQTVTLDPNAGQPGATVSVQGEGWPAGSRVIISLVPSEPPAYTVNSAVVDDTGQFSADIIVPTDSRWLEESPVPVVVTNDEGDLKAQSSLTIIAPSGQAPAATPGASNDYVVISTVPSATPPPPPANVAQLTTTANLNVRSGPGTNYNILGVLLEGQTAEIIGRNENSTWWQIKYLSAQQDVGWVSAEFVQAANISNVPIVTTPPAPAPPTPAPTATPDPGVTITEWRGEYYDNQDLSGSPVFLRNDLAISFDWGLGSPDQRIPVDFFSVRWTRDLFFNAGTYRFYARADDGVRLYIDGALLINGWREQSPTTYVADVYLTEGNHTIRMDYNELTGGAVAMLSWDRIDTFPDWRVEYFDNRDLQGSPVLVRNEGSINHNWGQGSPAPGIPADNFSVRWTRELSLNGGEYVVRAASDDGIRVWIDNDLIIDRWRDGYTGRLEESRDLSSGRHQLRVEYYERTGDAFVATSWQRRDRPPEPPLAVIRSPREGVVGQPVKFDGRRSREGDSDIDRYRWDFDDGSRTTGDKVSHTFKEPGDYRVELKVTDENGLSDRTRVTITIEDDLESTTAPVAVLNGPTTGKTGEALSFDGSRSYSLSPIVDYIWNFGDGSENRGGPNVSHTYSNPGTYNVTLTVVSENGLRSSDSQTVRVDSNLNPDDAPVARINAPSQGQTGQQIAFDASQSTAKNPIVTWEWNFGDGASATSGPTLPHIYDTPGVYNVGLTVTDNQGLSNSADHTITISDPPPPDEPPVAVVSGPSESEAGQNVTFDGSGSQSSGQITTYEWDLGDGSIASGEKVNHTYTQAGNFTVNLVVTDEDGRSGETTAPITVNPRVQPEPLTANISGPSQGQAGKTLTFDGQSSTSAGPLTSIQWDFGDGNIASDNLVASHAYDNPGTYVLLLTLVNELDQNDTASMEVVISEPPPPDTPPQAAIQLDETTIETGGAVTFDASGTQSASPITSYDWDFGDGESGSGQIVTHNYTQPGDYQVTLTVTDQNGRTGEATTSVTVNPRAEPDPLTTRIEGPNQATVGDPLSFDGQTSTSAAPLTTIQWDFGDGGTAGGSLTVNHTYKQPGNYTVQLALENELGQSNTATMDVNIEAAEVQPPIAGLPEGPAVEPPTAAINAPAQAGVNEPVVFDGGYSQATSPIVSYQWGFGDGQSGSGMGATHAYATPGTYKVTLTVTDENGLSSSDTADIEISSAGGAEVMPAPTEEPQPEVQPTEPPATEEPPAPETQPAEPPTAAIEGPTQVQAGQPLNFSAQSSSTGSSNIVQYQWGFGDGGTDSGPEVTYVYQAEGSYQLTLTVIDENGLGDTTSTTVFVGPSVEQIEAQQQAEEEARRQAEQEAQRQAEAEAQRQAEAEAQRQAQEAQQEADAQATAQAEEAQRQAEAEAQRQAEAEAQRQAEEAQQQAEEEARRQAEEEAQRQAEKQAKKQAKEEAKRQAQEARQQSQEQPPPEEAPPLEDGN